MGTICAPPVGWQASLHTVTANTNESLHNYAGPLTNNTRFAGYRLGLEHGIANLGDSSKAQNKTSVHSCKHMTVDTVHTIIGMLTYYR